MSPTFADNVACRRHVADMSPTFPAKIALTFKNTVMSYTLGVVQLFQLQKSAADEEIDAIGKIFEFQTTAT
jgi:hypothetical protein